MAIALRSIFIIAKCCEMTIMISLAFMILSKFSVRD